MLAARVAATEQSLADLAAVMTRLPQVLINVKGVDKTPGRRRAASSPRPSPRPRPNWARPAGCCCGPRAPSRWCGSWSRPPTSSQASTVAERLAERRARTARAPCSRALSAPTVRPGTVRGAGRATRQATAQSLRSRTPLHLVVRALAQHQGGPAAGRAHVLHQVGLVDGAPDLAGRSPAPPPPGPRRTGGSTEAGSWNAVSRSLRNRSRYQLLDVARCGRPRRSLKSKKSARPTRVRPSCPAARLQHVEALDDQDVGPAHGQPLARARCRRSGASRPARVTSAAPGLHVGDEAGQRPPVVGLGEALARHQPAALELGVGQQEAVGGDQLDPRVLGPAGQQRLQQPGGGGLADRDAARDADDERGARLAVAVARAARKVFSAPRRPRGRGDVQVEQPGERQVDVRDLVQVDRRRRGRAAARPRPRSAAAACARAARSTRARSSSTYGDGVAGAVGHGPTRTDRPVVRP